MAEAEQALQIVRHLLTSHPQGCDMKICGLVSAANHYRRATGTVEGRVRATGAQAQVEPSRPLCQRRPLTLACPPPAVCNPFPGQLFGESAADRDFEGLRSCLAALPR